jgi:hypothetical protein
MVARLAVTALSGRLLRARARGPSPPLSAWLMTSSRSHLAPTHSSTSCRTDKPRKSTSVGLALLPLTIGSACSATLRSCRPTSPPLAHTTPRARPRSHPHLLLLQPSCRPRQTRSRLIKRYVGGHGSASASSPTQSSVGLLRLWHAAVLGLARRPTCPRRANPVRRDTARGFALAGEHS